MGLLDQPKLGGAIVLALLAAAALWLAGWQLGEWPAWGALISMVGVIFGGGAAMLVYQWIAFLMVKYGKLEKDIRATTPELLILRAAANLREDQTAIVPKLSLRAEIDIEPGMTGPRYFLMTTGGHVPMEFIEDFLRGCGVTWLKPVRNYMDGTPGRMFATLFTDWCTYQGFAVPSDGPHPAGWMNEQAKSRCAAALGIDVSLETAEQGLRVLRELK